MQCGLFINFVHVHVYAQEVIRHSLSDELVGECDYNGQLSLAECQINEFRSSTQLLHYLSCQYLKFGVFYSPNY